MLCLLENKIYSLLVAFFNKVGMNFLYLFLLTSCIICTRKKANKNNYGTVPGLA